jgi:hypothetical protein
VRLPTHLCRGPVEPENPEIAAFYNRLLGLLKRETALRDGTWSQLDPQAAWAGNPTAQGFIAFAWQSPAAGNCLVVVNYTDHQGQCLLRLPFPNLRGTRFRLIDEMGSEVYIRDGDVLTDPGLFVDLGPWRFNVFRLEAA